MTIELKENLTNLNLFWQALSVTKSGDEINLHLSWPNKVWRSDFKRIAREKWNENTHVTLIKPEPQENVGIKTQLTAMHLVLDKAVGCKHEHVLLINSIDDLKKWCLVCEKAFDYKIDSHSLAPLLDDRNATILAFKVNKQLAGTAILYQSNNNMGIHQVGVLPQFQGQGIGKALLLHAIAISKNKSCKTMTLQASLAGSTMYLNSGFTTITELYHLESLSNHEIKNSPKVFK